MRPFAHQSGVAICLAVAVLSAQADTLEDLEKRYQELKHGKAAKEAEKFYVDQKDTSGKVSRQGPFSYKSDSLVTFLGTSYTIVDIDGNTFYLKRVGHPQKMGPCVMRDGATLLADSLTVRTAAQVTAERRAEAAKAIEQTIIDVHSRKWTLRKDVAALEKVLAENPEAPNRLHAERLLSRRKEEMNPGFSTVPTTKTSGGSYRTSFQVKCPTCSGSGVTPGTRRPTKAGRLTTGGYKIPKCATCNGSGKIETAQCPSCAGAGSVERGKVMKDGKLVADFVSCPQCDGLRRREEAARAAETAKKKASSPTPTVAQPDYEGELNKVADAFAKGLVEAGRILSAKQMTVRRGKRSVGGRIVQTARVNYRFTSRTADAGVKHTDGYLVFRYDAEKKKWVNSETHIE